MSEQSMHRRRWAILGVLVLCLLVVILDNTILNVALKTIQEDLGASQSQMQWAVDSYALVFAGLLITGGVLGDRLGRKRVLLFGMLAFGGTSVLCSFAGSSTELILFRSLMGIGAAAVQPQTLSIIQNVFEPRERPKAIGIWAGASGAAIALGPIAGGVLLKYFWWGSIFLINVPIVVIGVIAIAILVPDSKDPKPGRLDPVGVLLSIVALVVLVYGVIQGGETNRWLRWDTSGAIALGGALLALFVWLQKRSAHPTIDVTLFQNRHFTSGAVAIATTFFALMGSTFYLAYYLQAVRGYTPLAAGVALIAVAGAVMIAAPLSARLSQRFGPRLVTGSGLHNLRPDHGLLRLRHRDDATVGRRGDDVRHGHRNGAHDVAGHQCDHERGAQAQGRRWFGSEQHGPAGGRRARCRDPGIHPGRRLPGTSGLGYSGGRRRPFGPARRGCRHAAALGAGHHVRDDQHQSVDRQRPDVRP